MKIRRKKDKEKEKIDNQFLDGMKKVGREYKKIVGDSLSGLVGK